jgi:hypothetical protein
MSVAELTINLILTNYLIDSTEMDQSVKEFYKLITVCITLNYIYKINGNI